MFYDFVSKLAFFTNVFRRGRNDRALCRFFGVFFVVFHDLPSQIAFFQLRYIAVFLIYASTLRTLNLIP